LKHHDSTAITGFQGAEQVKGVRMMVYFTRIAGGKYNKIRTTEFNFVKIIESRGDG